MDKPLKSMPDLRLLFNHHPLLKVAIWKRNSPDLNPRPSESRVKRPEYYATRTTRHTHNADVSAVERWCASGRTGRGSTGCDSRRRTVTRAWLQLPPSSPSVREPSSRSPPRAASVSGPTDPWNYINQRPTSQSKLSTTTPAAAAATTPI